MNAKQIKEATRIAQDTNIDLSNEDDSVLYGCGLSDFKKVYVSIRTVAKLLRWQCQFLFGGWDWREYNENMVPVMRRKILIIDEKPFDDFETQVQCEEVFTKE